MIGSHGILIVWALVTNIWVREFSSYRIQSRHISATTSKNLWQVFGEKRNYRPGLCSPTLKPCFKSSYIFIAKRCLIESEKGIKDQSKSTSFCLSSIKQFFGKMIALTDLCEIKWGDFEEYENYVDNGICHNICFSNLSIWINAQWYSPTYLFTILVSLTPLKSLKWYPLYP